MRAPSPTFLRASVGCLVCGVRPKKRYQHKKEQEVERQRGKSKPQTHSKNPKERAPEGQRIVRIRWGPNGSRERGSKEPNRGDERMRKGEKNKTWPRWTQKNKCDSPPFSYVHKCPVRPWALSLQEWGERERGEKASLHGKAAAVVPEGAMFTL